MAGTYPIYNQGRTPAVAGWLGTMFLDDTPIRFTSESVAIPQGLEVATDIHVGQRVPAVFEYRFIVPEGSISFPLVCDPSVAISYGLGDFALDSGITTLMRAAIQPYTAQTSYPPTDVPIIGDFLTIYRGDVVKTITTPWANSISVEGSANGRINVSLGVKGVYGGFSSTNNTAPPSVGGTVRAIFFNELHWTTAFLDAFRTDLNEETDTSYAPRSFNCSINNNLVNDDSYNDENPQAIRGFVFGLQDVSCDMTFVGAADPHRGGTENVSQYPSPLISDLVTGAENYVSIGGIYDILDGVWTAKTLDVPGPTEITTTNVTLKGMSSSAGSIFSVVPGVMLGG